MKSLYEEFGGTYTLGNDGMLYSDLVIGDKDPRSIGKMGQDAHEVPGGGTSGAVRAANSEWYASQAFGRCKRASNSHAGKADCSDGCAGGCYGAPEGRAAD